MEGEAEQVEEDTKMAWRSCWLIIAFSLNGNNLLDHNREQLQNLTGFLHSRPLGLYRTTVCQSERTETLLFLFSCVLKESQQSIGPSDCPPARSAL